MCDVCHRNVSNTQFCNANSIVHIFCSQSTCRKCHYNGVSCYSTSVAMFDPFVHPFAFAMSPKHHMIKIQPVTSYCAVWFTCIFPDTQFLWYLLKLDHRLGCSEPSVSPSHSMPIGSHYAPGLLIVLCALLSLYCQVWMGVHPQRWSCPPCWLAVKSMPNWKRPIRKPHSFEVTGMWPLQIWSSPHMWSLDYSALRPFLVSKHPAAESQVACVFRAACHCMICPNMAFYSIFEVA